MAAFTAPTPISFATVAEADASAVQLQLRALEQTAGLYTEDAVVALEAYLAEQLAGATVDADANLALLKLYLIFPERADAAKVAAVLLKGVQATPSPYFTGATTLVPESLREDATVKLALEAGFLLQSCLFEEFWKLDLAAAEAAAPGTLTAARAFILDAVRKSHSVVSTALLKAALSVSDAEVAAVVAAEHWTLEGELAKIPANGENQVRPKKIQEKIEFEDVLKLIDTLSR
ncbi:hypothetical protein PybrP1_003409 [[Pythium] brassicae (nom. inval.)]|nr:hypothetical protein PybrP1_003409 [[Pythium] brassicae (nom. inval.)]